jgi:DNA helicase-2/ATP-dependent DNA helicase PcrA
VLDSLTSAQREAVQHVDGPLLILAGPGSGKTRVVTHRIAYLLQQGVPAGSILALTFTNKAADEMRARVERLAPGEGVWMGTFHRFCARLLRRYAPLVGLDANFTIYDADDSRRVLRRTIDSLKFPIAHLSPEQIAAAISAAKNNVQTPADCQQTAHSPMSAILRELYPAYQSRLIESNAVDFDDLLLHIATILRENPEIRRSLDSRYRYVMVDEYQDTNLAQYEIARALSFDHPNLAVTGDPDQSIYGWRGANLNNILSFERDFPTARVVRLEQNYRSTKKILRVAAELISHNRRRKAKNLYTDNEDGRPVRCDTYETNVAEAAAIARQIADAVRSSRRRLRDFAIFYRVNALTRSLEFALREAGLVYQIVNGQQFFARAEIKDVVAYLQLMNNPKNDEAFLRIVNRPLRGIGKSTLDRLAEFAQERRLTLLEAARERDKAALTARAATALGEFVKLVDELSKSSHLPVEEVLGHVYAETGYKKMLQATETEEDLQRLANIDELLTEARAFDANHAGGGRLEEFLEQVCLTSDTDAYESADDRVTLMTLHSAKGLEFPVVFIIGMEEGLIPHERSRQDPLQLEEERRLLFVGITRAREELQLTRAAIRDSRGVRKRTIPSVFLFELPRDELETHEEVAESLRVEPIDGEFPTARQPAPLPSPGRAWATRLTTAAELSGEQAATPSSVSAEEFYQGMLVRHPEYGLGKIVALSGEPPMRRATVNFASAAGERKFILEKSPLRPAKPG